MSAIDIYLVHRIAQLRLYARRILRQQFQKAQNYISESLLVYLRLSNDIGK